MRNVIHGDNFEEIMVSYKTGNAIFQEVERPLDGIQVDHIRKRVALGEKDGLAIDINGNKVGTWKVQS